MKYIGEHNGVAIRKGQKPWSGCRIAHMPDSIMHCMDLKQYSKMLGDPPHPKQLGGEHNALEDALWNKRLYEYLRSL